MSWSVYSSEGHRNLAELNGFRISNLVTTTYYLPGALNLTNSAMHGSQRSWFTHSQTYTHTHIYIYIHIMYVCISVCIYIYIHIYSCKRRSVGHIRARTHAQTDGVAYRHMHSTSGSWRSKDLPAMGLVSHTSQAWRRPALFPLPAPPTPRPGVFDTSQPYQEIRTDESEMEIFLHCAGAGHHSWP